LNNLSDAEDRLSEGIKILKADDGVQALISSSSDSEEICSAAIVYYKGQIKSLEKTGRISAYIIAAMFISAALAMAAAALRFINSKATGKYVCLAACALAMAAAMLWRGFCTVLGGAIVYGALAIAIIGLILSLGRGINSETV